MFSLPIIQARMLKIETAVSIFINGAVFPVLLWLAPIPPPAELWGPDGVAASLVKGTVIPVFLMSTLLTFILRKRLAKMGLAPADRSASPFPWLGALPQPPPLRALIFVLAALVTIMPISLATAALLKTWPLTEAGFFLFNVIYGVVIGCVVTPFVVLAAMHEPRSAPPALAEAH